MGSLDDKKNEKKMSPFVLMLIVCGTMVCIRLFFRYHHEFQLFPGSVAEEMKTFEQSLGDKRLPHKEVMKSDIVYPTVQEYDPSQYPKYQTLLDVVSNWNPDDPEVPVPFKETLQHFDYSNPKERAMAAVYRDSEVPFKLYNVPEFDEVVSKWTNEYLSRELARMDTHVEKSVSNHFMFWNRGNRDRIKDYKPPTQFINGMSFDQWLELAQQADERKLGNNSIHYYFQTGSTVHDRKTKHNMVARDLTLFTEYTNPNFFVTKPSANKGIQCRFGMRGIIAESHYDSGRNMIAMLKGSKRYIINPPRACEHLGIISDTKHPSYRHSVIDWSDISQARAHGFDRVEAIDTIVRQGEVLYLPSFWFHYIISLEYSIQCNSRRFPGVHDRGEGY